MPRPIALALAVFGLGVAFAPPATAQGGDTTAADSGLYSEQQARRGQTQFTRACIRCHAPDAFTGTFIESWSGAPVSMLLDLVSSTMPEDRPGSLERRQYVDILAYILELNGLTPGQRELPVDQGQLEHILIKRRP
ncbi:MAG TPA: hypothetical protein VGA37_08780 [Gemmatimonadales bacterium]